MQANVLFSYVCTRHVQANSKYLLQILEYLRLLMMQGHHESINQTASPNKFPFSLLSTAYCLHSTLSSLISTLSSLLSTIIL